MKKLLAIIFIAATAHAQDLVDVTPGGFESGHMPPVFFKLFSPEMHFYDEAAQGWFHLPEGWRYLNQWVSRYGDLDGGTYFFTNLFVLQHPFNANVWWNFIGAPAGYRLALIHVTGWRSNGVAWEHLYLVRRSLAGESRITVDNGTTPIWSIAFYGYEQ